MIGSEPQKILDPSLWDLNEEEKCNNSTMTWAAPGCIQPRACWWLYPVLGQNVSGSINKKEDQRVRNMTKSFCLVSFHHIITTFWNPCSFFNLIVFFFSGRDEIDCWPWLIWFNPAMKSPFKMPQWMTCNTSQIISKAISE